MSTYWLDLLVFGGAFALFLIALVVSDAKPTNRYRKGRKDVLPPPSPACKRDYA